MSPLTASARLRAKLSLVEAGPHGATAALWRADRPRERYLAYLVTMHQVIRGSVPLMERAAELADRAAARDADPLGAPLARYLRAHALEEADHDLWLLEDLAAAGADTGAVLGAIPPPDVAALTGAQHYWIEHHHPLALVGYIAVLEGHAPAALLGAVLARRTGLPEAAFRTVEAHARLDAGHVDDVYALLDTLPLTGRDEALLAVSALHTVDALTSIFVRLGRRAPAAVPLRETGRPTSTGGPG
ncbi:iron-containing redox enzyme family protein [Streptomyces sp. TP-A0874]|uniref:iron-containing redox enzyme family protein n=1 Tax=Streptomyces sp. TP-A0874 TaxID=549819 RepID=UPI0008535BA6|nr:iron-containing redox enzyme family protein [Streptomyces sp. TP-A0874]